MLTNYVFEIIDNYEWWSLESEFDVSISLGSLSMVLIISILLVLMIVLCRGFKHAKKDKSFMKALRTDLHPSKGWLVALYYIHFFSMRFLVLILVGLSS